MDARSLGGFHHAESVSCNSVFVLADQSRAFIPERPPAYEQTLNQNVWGQLPQIVVDSRDGFTIGNPARFGQGSYPDERIVRAQQSFDWIHGSLLVRAGASYSLNSDRTTLLRNQTGTYHYSSVENFISDALVFKTYGLSNALDKFNQHNCDQNGRSWRDSNGVLRGLGYLPCYSYYSQMMGPNNWAMSTDDWSGFATAQWQPSKLFVLSAGLRWDLEQLPPPHRRLANPDLPLGWQNSSLGSNWGRGSASLLETLSGAFPSCGWATACITRRVQNGHS